MVEGIANKKQKGWSQESEERKRKIDKSRDWGRKGDKQGRKGIGRSFEMWERVTVLLLHSVHINPSWCKNTAECRVWGFTRSCSFGRDMEVSAAFILSSFITAPPSLFYPLLSVSLRAAQSGPHSAVGHFSLLKLVLLCTSISHHCWWMENKPLSCSQLVCHLPWVALCQ